MDRKKLRSAELNKARTERLEEIRESIKKPRGLASYNNLLKPNEDLVVDEIPPHVPFSGFKGGSNPSISDPGVREVILNKIREGNYPATAALFAGISFEQFKVALQKGRDGKDLLYYKFWMDVCQAEAEAEVARLANLSEHAQKDWKAELEIMSRRWPDRWGTKTQKIEITGTVEHSLRNEFAAKILGDPISRELARQLITRQAETVDGEFSELPPSG